MVPFLSNQILRILHKFLHKLTIVQKMMKFKDCLWGNSWKGLRTYKNIFISVFNLTFFFKEAYLYFYELRSAELINERFFIKGLFYVFVNWHYNTIFGSTNKTKTILFFDTIVKNIFYINLKCQNTILLLLKKTNSSIKSSYIFILYD